LLCLQIRVSSSIMVSLVPCRVIQICEFFVDVCGEHKIASGRIKVCLSEAAVPPVMSRRGVQPHSPLDRTSSACAMFMIYDLKDNFPLLLFCIVAMTYCFTNSRNLEAAGGPCTLLKLYDRWDDVTYVQSLAKEWAKAKWYRKTYNVNQSLARLVPEGTVPLGCLRFLLRWRAVVGQDVCQELGAQPGMARTILERTRHLPFWPNLRARRLLGLWCRPWPSQDALR
jgi:hypothetical protein